MGKIIGTAGHVDHGKTELIKALTGIDTDRLSEEKERGLTIDLGFAYIDLEKSGRIGIIDVPGHERFMKNMLAGVGGMDVVILVVAANESVMPQTVEHFHILRFLGVKDIIVGISKIDLVDEETRVIVREEVTDLIGNSPYQEAPIVEFSSVSGEGLQKVREVLDERVAAIGERGSGEQFTRLAIDRCFDLKGIGTVITGTLLSGSLREGEEIVILPSGQKTRARQIQEHNIKKKQVAAGERVAVNLPGISKGMVKRGNIISKENELLPTERLLLSIEPIKGCGTIKDLERVKIYLGSGEFLGRLELIGRRKISQEERFVSYLLCEEKIVAVRKDRCIIRRYSPMKLLGGGIVLDSYPEIRKRFSKGVAQDVEKLVDSDEEETLLAFLQGKHLPIERVRLKMQIPPDDFKKLCDGLLKKGKIEILGEEIFSSEGREVVQDEVEKSVKNYHERNPLKRGMDKEALRNKIGIERQTLDLLLSMMSSITVDKNLVRMSGFSPKFDKDTLKRRDAILHSLKRDPFKPESIQEDDLVRALIEEGEIVKVKSGLYFHKDAVERGKRLIGNAIKKNGPLSAGHLKDVLKTTRKYAIPFLEYLDQIKFTVRKGDVRDLK
jgi:selenocysteine-specific elongation factor